MLANGRRDLTGRLKGWYICCLWELTAHCFSFVSCFVVLTAGWHFSILSVIRVVTTPAKAFSKVLVTWCADNCRQSNELNAMTANWACCPQVMYHWNSEGCRMYLFGSESEIVSVLNGSAVHSRHWMYITTSLDEVEWAASHLAHCWGKRRGTHLTEGWWVLESVWTWRAFAVNWIPITRSCIPLIILTANNEHCCLNDP
jgi:hypothetical protein